MFFGESKFSKEKEQCSTCSGGLLKAGETEMLATRPEPDSISLRIPLMPRSSKVLAPRGDPLAHVESSRIKPCMPFSQNWSHQIKKLFLNWKMKARIKHTVYVGVLRDAWPPPELLVEMSEAACVTRPWLHNSSSLSGDVANASAIRVKQTEACSSTYTHTHRVEETTSQGDKPTNAIALYCEPTERWPYLCIMILKKVCQ